MGKNDVNIDVKVGQAEEAKRKLDQTAKAAENVGKKTDEAGKRGARGTEKAAASTDKLTRSVKKSGSAVSGLTTKIGAWAAGFLGVTGAIAAITTAIRLQNAELEENATLLSKQQKSLLRLQFLGDFFKEKPELRKEVIELSEFGRRPFEEVANAWYNLRSKNAGLAPDQRMSILREALEMGRTDPDLPLDTLVDMFSLYAKKSDTTDANQVQNVLQQTITEAGGSGSDVASYMPRFLPIGMGGGLSGAESAGLWAYATTQSSEASIATTGLKALFLGLQGKGTPESARMLEQSGISPDQDFFSKMQTLSGQYASGSFGLAEAEQLAGREGADILLSLLNDPEGLMRTVNSVTGADRGDIDLTKKKIEELFGSDEVAALEEDTRLLNIEIENIRGTDVRSAKAKKTLLQHEKVLRKHGEPETGIAFTQWFLKMYYAMGGDPDEFAESMQHLPEFRDGPLPELKQDKVTKQKDEKWLKHEEAFKKKFNDFLPEWDDPEIPNDVEPYWEELPRIWRKLDKIIPSLSGKQKRDAQKLRRRVHTTWRSIGPSSREAPVRQATKEDFIALEEIQQSIGVTTVINDHSINNYPVTNTTGVGKPRFDNNEE